MSPVQVYHICDVCGYRTTRENETMVSMRTTVDRHQETLALDLVCHNCRHAIHEACRAAIAERKGHANQIATHTS